MNSMRGGGHLRDEEGDLAMEDTDPYDHRYEEGTNTRDYPIRPQHRQRPSQTQFLHQEESSAAKRYSPMSMKVSSPNQQSFTSQHILGSQNNAYNAYNPAFESNPQSPSRNQNFSPHSQFGSPSSSSPKHEPSETHTNGAHAASSRTHIPHTPSSFSPSANNDNGYQPPRSATQQLNSVFGIEGLSGSSNLQVPQPNFQKTLQPPKFTRVSNVSDLRPQVNPAPPFRRANPQGGFFSPLQALTTQLPETYRICNHGFKYESSRNPRRVLTKPSKGCKNDGYDNDDSDYILYVNDILGSEETGHKNRYLILDVLGQGTFGQVVKCQNLKTQEVVAVKVVKNRTAYFNQSMMEVSVLDLLNSKLDKNDDHHLLRLKDTFIHRQHLCLVFELLSVNLYELINQNQFRGLSTTLVRVFAQQLLNGLSLLNKARIIHCDLKPENILLKNLESPIIKIIDFGSACDERQTVYTYIQSRFYRSPEVLLGLPYSAAIDMWSLGCIVVELFLGLPLFPGSSEYNQVSRITEMLGQPPTWMLEVGKQSGEFFERTQDEFGRKTYRLKSMQQYSLEHKTQEQPSKKYFNATNLNELIMSYAWPRKNMKPAEMEREIANRKAFVDFVRGLLCLNPLERWSPQQAKLHPFITQSKFTGPFVPPMNLKASSVNKSPAPGIQQQQQAESLSKHRAQAQQAAQMQAQNAYAMQQMQQQQAVNAHHYNAPQTQPMFGAGYAAAGPPPPYPAQQQGYAQSMNAVPSQMHYGQPSLQVQAAARNAATRQRASTMAVEQQQSGVPASLQRVVSHLDPNAPIRLQPSPAYYPPRTRDRQQAQSRGNERLIQSLEERSAEEGYNSGTGSYAGWH